MRKPKFEVGEMADVNGNGPRDYCGRRGQITERGPGKAEYGVRFSDGRHPNEGYLDSRCLDRMPSESRQ